MQNVKIGNFPSLGELMKQALQNGVEMMVRDRSSELLGVDKGDITDGVKIVGAATLNQLFLEADAAMFF